MLDALTDGHNPVCEARVKPVLYRCANAFWCLAPGMNQGHIHSIKKPGENGCVAINSGLCIDQFNVVSLNSVPDLPHVGSVNFILKGHGQ